MAIEYFQTPVLPYIPLHALAQIQTFPSLGHVISPSDMTNDLE